MRDRSSDRSSDKSKSSSSQPEIYLEAMSLTHRDLLRRAFAGAPWDGKTHIAGNDASLDQIRAGARELYDIGVLDQSRRLTVVGQDIRMLVDRQPPIPPRLAVCLRAAKVIGDLDTAQQVAKLVAICSASKPLPVYPAGQWLNAEKAHRSFVQDGETDATMLINIFDAVQRIERESGADEAFAFSRRLFLSFRAYSEASAIWTFLSRHLEQSPNLSAGSRPVPENALAACLLAGHWDRLVKPPTFSENRIWSGLGGLKAYMPMDSCCSQLGFEGVLAIGFGLVHLLDGSKAFVAMVPVEPEWVEATVKKYPDIFPAVPRIQSRDEGYQMGPGKRSVLCHRVWYCGMNSRLGGNDVLARRDWIPATPGEETADLLAAAIIESGIELPLSPNLKLVRRAAFRSAGCSPDSSRAPLPNPSTTLLVHWLRDVLLRVSSVDDFLREARLEKWNWGRIAAFAGMPDIVLQTRFALMDFPDEIRIGPHHLTVEYCEDGRIELRLYQKGNLDPQTAWKIASDQLSWLLPMLTEDVLPRAWKGRSVYMIIERPVLSARFINDDLDELRRQFFCHGAYDKLASFTGDLLDSIDRLTCRVLVPHPHGMETLYAVAGSRCLFTDWHSASEAVRNFVIAGIRDRLVLAASELQFAFCEEMNLQNLSSLSSSGHSLVQYGVDGLPTEASLKQAIARVEEEYARLLADHQQKCADALWRVRVIRLHAQDCNAEHTVAETVTKVLRLLGFKEGASLDRVLPNWSQLDQLVQSLTICALPLTPIDEQTMKALTLRLKIADFEARLMRTHGDTKTPAVNAVAALKRLFEQSSAKPAKLDEALGKLPEVKSKVDIADRMGGGRKSGRVRSQSEDSSQS